MPIIKEPTYKCEGYRETGASGQKHYERTECERKASGRCHSCGYYLCRVHANGNSRLGAGHYEEDKKNEKIIMWCGMCYRLEYYY